MSPVCVSLSILLTHLLQISCTLYVPLLIDWVIQERSQVNNIMFQCKLLHFVLCQHLFWCYLYVLIRFFRTTCMYSYFLFRTFPPFQKWTRCIILSQDYLCDCFVGCTPPLQSSSLVAVCHCRLCRVAVYNLFCMACRTATSKECETYCQSRKE